MLTTVWIIVGKIIINKFDKTNALLQAGVDLVLEFPFILSTQSSDYFASNAISILNEIGVNHIICGCENENTNNLEYFYSLESTSQFHFILKENLKKFKYHSNFEKKREKRMQDMRNSLEIGDGVITAGGIVGRVISIKEDTLVIESASSKLRIKRWAVSEVEKLDA